MQVLADRVVQRRRPRHDDPLRRVPLAPLQRRGIDRVDGQPQAAAAVPLEHIREVLQHDVRLDCRDLGHFLETTRVPGPVGLEHLPAFRRSLVDVLHRGGDALLVALLGLGDPFLVRVVGAGDGHPDGVQVFPPGELHERQAPIPRQQDELAVAVERVALEPRGKLTQERMARQVDGFLELVAVSLLHEGGDREVVALRRADRAGLLAERPVHHDVPGDMAARDELELAVGAVFQVGVDPAVDAVTLRRGGGVLVVGIQSLGDVEDDIAQASDGDIAGLHPVGQFHGDRPLAGRIHPVIDLQRLAGPLEVVDLHPAHLLVGNGRRRDGLRENRHGQGDREPTDQSGARSHDVLPSGQRVPLRPGRETNCIVAPAAPPRSRQPGESLPPDSAASRRRGRGASHARICGVPND